MMDKTIGALSVDASPWGIISLIYFIFSYPSFLYSRSENQLVRLCHRSVSVDASPWGCQTKKDRFYLSFFVLYSRLEIEFVRTPFDLLT